MKKYAHELKFIGQVKRDGSGIKEVDPEFIKSMTENPLVKNDKFKLKRLSLSHDTYLAFNFNVFVVRVKE